MQISISIFSMLIVVQATAQITVNNTTFPVIGDTLRYQTDSNPPVLNFGTVGGGSELLGSVGTDTTVAFHFFNHLEKEEIAVLTMNNAGTAVQSVRFKYVPIVNAVADFQGQKPALSISPNPASGFVNLRLKNFPVEDIVLKINDLNGKLLFEKNIYINNGELRIDLTGFPAGHFFIQIFDKNGTRLAARKLLKQV